MALKMLAVRTDRIEFDEDGTLSEGIAIGERRGLKVVGFRTAAEAKSMISNSPGPSMPGQPPHGHTGTLKRFLRYAVQAMSVFVGPQLLNRRSKDVTSALERGGVSADVKGRQQLVAKRPLMKPAMMNMVRSQGVPKAFENVIRK